MTETTITRVTHAVAYAAAIEDGATPSIDLTHADVEVDGEGRELNTAEAGWDNLGGATAWGTAAADQLLAGSGWVRTGDWTWRSDIAGVQGWDAPVARA
jgi:hypothetical protein